MLSVYTKRVYEIVNEKKAIDKHEDITLRMKWAKFAELSEVRHLHLSLEIQEVRSSNKSLFLYIADHPNFSRVESFRSYCSENLLGIRYRNRDNVMDGIFLLGGANNNNHWLR